MRPCKFRAWDVDAKTWIPVECFYVAPETGEIFTNDEQDARDQWKREVIPYVLEQFTGLQDKNGKDIYEGDVVKHNGVVFPVRWESTGMWNLAIHLMNLDSSMDACEVIGDIHSNPELLERK